MKIKLHTLLGVFGIAAVALLSGCATGRHTLVDTKQFYDPQPDKALVVFMRPSSLGAAITSVIFHAKPDSNELIAAIGPKEKVAYYCEPGEQRFMVIAENADFLDANLEAGKIYYAIATPRMGWWKARFSLHPFKQNHKKEEFSLGSRNLREWLDSCQFVVPNNDSYAYARNNATSIQKRRDEYMVKWERMLEKDKQWRRLEPEDGLTEPIQ